MLWASGILGNWKAMPFKCRWKAKREEPGASLENQHLLVNDFGNNLTSPRLFPFLNNRYLKGFRIKKREAIKFYVNDIVLCTCVLLLLYQEKLLYLHSMQFPCVGREVSGQGATGKGHQCSSLSWCSEGRNGIESPRALGFPYELRHSFLLETPEDNLSIAISQSEKKKVHIGYNCQTSCN